MTYAEKVLEILKDGRGLTAKEAWLEESCGMRLAATIKNLRNAGHDIVTEKVAVEAQGRTIQSARYWLRQFAPGARAPGELFAVPAERDEH